MRKTQRIKDRGGILKSTESYSDKQAKAFNI
jgi:hypothetical protein